MRLLRVTIPRRVSRLLVALLAGTSVGVPAWAASPTAATPRLTAAWSRTRGEVGDWAEYKALASSPANGLWVAFSERDLAARTTTSWIWRLGTEGEDLGAFKIEAPADQPTGGPRDSDVRAMAPLANGDMLVLLALAGDQPWLLRLDRDGKPLAARNVVGRGREVGVTRMLPAADGNFLLLGHESSNAVALKIDPTGKILWEKKDDRGKTELFVDGLVDPDGGFVVVGNSGVYDYSLRGESTVWIAAWDKEGNPRAEKSFAGRQGSVARGSDGGYALVYDASVSDARRIRLQLLGAGLEERQGSDVIESPTGRATFKVLPAPRGDGFVVAGSKDYLPWLAHVSKAGAPAVTFFDETIDPGVTHEALSAPDGFFVASSILRRPAGKPAYQALRLLRLVSR